MNDVLKILISLGLNETVYPQFAIFILTFIFLKVLIFKPYLNAYLERRKRTVGSQDVAKEILADIAAREAQYSKEAKDINSKIKVIFDEKRTLAQKESTAILTEAQTQAQEKLAKGKKELGDTYAKAREQIKTYIPDLGQTIKQRLLDR
jgi:F0F1-type ATP synthase membrane subunit b/b'